jgi:hypothetical protein
LFGALDGHLPSFGVYRFYGFAHETSSAVWPVTCGNPILQCKSTFSCGSFFQIVFHSLICQVNNFLTSIGFSGHWSTSDVHGDDEWDRKHPLLCRFGNCLSICLRSPGM